MDRVARCARQAVGRRPRALRPLQAPETGAHAPRRPPAPHPDALHQHDLPEQEPYFPGDEEMELRIRRLIRWNAVAMVVRANHHYEGIGGHLATYASAASLYEVGFNHFFRGKDDGAAGDQIFFQGHAAPGIYARAF